jgi:tetratricopeptide (TPR) repeat protein
MARRPPELAKAVQFVRDGRLDDAERSYRSVLRAEPRSFEAARGLGMISARRGALADAERHFALASQIDPGAAQAHLDRALVLLALKRPDEALVCCDRALVLAPQDAAAHRTRAKALFALRRDDEALAIPAGDAETYYLRGNALLRQCKASEALESFEQAVQLAPSMAAAFNNRGNALRELNRLDEALHSYAKAVALEPNNAVLCYNHALALQDCGRFDEAMAAYNRAIGLKTDFAEARKARASLKFLLGRMSDGFADFEWRRRIADRTLDPRIARIRYWSGEGLSGKSIVVYGDGAFGDLVQFSRYLPLLAAMGAEVLLLAPPQFHKVLCEAALKVRPIGDIGEAGGPDFRCEFLSLPHLVGTGIPPVVDPVLHDARRIEKWAAVLGRDRRNVGICWQGNPERDIDKGRSIPLAAFHPLAQVPGVNLVSLQRKHGLDQLAQLPGEMKVRELGPDFDAGDDAFVDTAAVMQSLDLVVTSDTAIAHVAASMGRPTWIALRAVPEWRWQLGRSDSPWYPSVRLFRQTQADDWAPVFDEIAAALRALAPGR